MGQHLFHCYLAILCWIPIPLASKHPLFQGLFVILISILSLFCLWHWRHAEKKLPRALHRSWPSLILFAWVLLWLMIQLYPLPFEWVAQLSPERVKYLGFETSVSVLPLSFHPGAGIRRLLLSIGYVQLFVLTLLLVNSESRLRSLLYTLVIAGTVQALYASLMTLSGLEKQLWFDKEAHIGFATGTLLNRNHLANYLTFTAAAAIGLLLANSRVGSINSWRQLLRAIIEWLLSNKGMLRVLLVVMVIGLILTRSRMGNMAFFISLGLSAFLWLIATGKFNRTTFLLFASLLVVDTLLVGMWFGVDKVAERISNTNTDIELRYQLAPDMVSMAGDFWLAGSGAGTFADTFTPYKQTTTRLWFNEAHNDYLQFLIEFGLIGSLPLLIIVLISVFKIVQTLRHRNARLMLATGFSCLMALTASGLHASVEYNLQRPATAALFVVFLALPWVTAHAPSAQKLRRKNAGRSSRPAHVSVPHASTPGVSVHNAMKARP